MFRQVVAPLTIALALGAPITACKKEPPPKPPVAKPVAAATFDGTIDEIFSAWLTASPVTATTLGEHAHDGKWPDLGTAGLAADRKRIDDALAEVRTLAAGQLTPDQRIDLDVVRNELELQKFSHEVEQPWRRDPSWYTSTIGNGLDDLVSREFAPLEVRGAAVASRLEGLPALVEHARTNLVAAECYEPQTRVAIGQIEGIAQLLEQVIPERLGHAPKDLRDRITKATPPAVAAIRALQAELDQKILPAAKGQWRLGAENFERKLALTLQSNITAAELRRVAVVEHGRVRKRMAELAYDLAAVLFTPRQVARMKARASGDQDTEVIRGVLEELAAAHVEPDALRESIDATLSRLSAFVKEKQVVSMDDAEVLQVIWTPPHQRGVFIAGLAAPGPLEPSAAGLPSFYLVQPVPTEWSEDVRESFLREYNDFMLEILSIHEAIPGHFVQLYSAKREPSKVRKVLANGAFVEGWAVYAEKVMVDAGYAGVGPAADAKRPRGVSKGTWTVLQDPTLRAKAIALHGLKFYLRSVTNAILDHGVHAGNMSEAEAVELMVQRSFQQEGEARGKWVRAQVTSTQLSTYFVGAQAWLRLRAHAEADARDAGKPFDMAAFHDAALSHGAPPVHRLPILLGWDEKPAAATAPAATTPAATTKPPPG